ncbi:MAG: type II toxin-antitoxin system mRNA interferase toxin, RelE/StbE family [Patescibacteria group bacterium]|mgnify:CR=1 FL=1
MKHEFHRRFLKELAKLSLKHEERFYERLALFLNAPDHPLLHRHPLHGKYAGYWSIDVTGDLRAVYRIQGYACVFTHIGTHHQLFGS